MPITQAVHQKRCPLFKQCPLSKTYQKDTRRCVYSRANHQASPEPKLLLAGAIAAGILQGGLSSPCLRAQPQKTTIPSDIQSNVQSNLNNSTLLQQYTFIYGTKSRLPRPYWISRFDCRPPEQLPDNCMMQGAPGRYTPIHQICMCRKHWTMSSGT